MIPYLCKLVSEGDLETSLARGSACFRRGRTDNLCHAAELSNTSATSPISRSGSNLIFLQHGSVQSSSSPSLIPHHYPSLSTPRLSCRLTSFSANRSELARVPLKARCCRVVRQRFSRFFFVTCSWFVQPIYSATRKDKFKIAFPPRSSGYFILRLLIVDKNRDFPFVTRLFTKPRAQKYRRENKQREQARVETILHRLTRRLNAHLLVLCVRNAFLLIHVSDAYFFRFASKIPQMQFSSISFDLFFFSKN